MKFSIVQNGGYKVQEVDSFIRKIKKMETAGWTSRSSVKLQSVRFTLTKAKGYKTSEVDDYLDSLLTQKSNQLGLETKGNNPVLTGFPSPNIDAPLSPAITSARLRDLTPPVVDGIGYRKEEVDRFFNLVADSLQIFEESSIEETLKLKADQYDPNGHSPKLLTGDQVRWALFTVDETSGYDILAIDAAVNRLSKALDNYWCKPE